MKPLGQLGVPGDAGQDLSEPLGGLVRGDASVDGLVGHPRLGQAAEPIGKEDVEDAFEKPVLRWSPALPDRNIKILNRPLRDRSFKHLSSYFEICSSHSSFSSSDFASGLRKFACLSHSSMFLTALMRS